MLVAACIALDIWRLSYWSLASSDESKSLHSETKCNNNTTVPVVGILEVKRGTKERRAKKFKFQLIRHPREGCWMTLIEFEILWNADVEQLTNNRICHLDAVALIGFGTKRKEKLTCCFSNLSTSWYDHYYIPKLRMNEKTCQFPTRQMISPAITNIWIIILTLSTAFHSAEMPSPLPETSAMICTQTSYKLCEQAHGFNWMPGCYVVFNEKRTIDEIWENPTKGSTEFISNQRKSIGTVRKPFLILLSWSLIRGGLLGFPDACVYEFIWSWIFTWILFLLLILCFVLIVRIFILLPNPKSHV